MRDAIGGVMSLQIIVIFLILVNCYLAFSVNYTKAFRVKNEIRSIIEKNEGLTDSACNQIKDLMFKASYSINEGYTTWCQNNGYQVATTDAGSFCFKYELVDATGDKNPNNPYKGSYYTIATFVDMDIPLMDRILPFAGGAFIIKGETSLIYSSGNGSEVSGCTPTASSGTSGTSGTSG